MTIRINAGMHASEGHAFTATTARIHPVFVGIRLRFPIEWAFFFFTGDGSRIATMRTCRHNPSILNRTVMSIGIVSLLLVMHRGAQGSDIFVTNENNDTVGEYTTSGTTVNASLITGLSSPIAIAVSGSDIFVASLVGGTISEYTTSGTLVNASLISEPNLPVAIAVSGSDIFVANLNTNTIGEYTTSGATVNAALITGLNSPDGIAVSGSDIFVANAGTNTIGEYTTSGATVNAALITGLSEPSDIAVVSGVAVPEPSALVMMSFGSAVLFAALLRRRTA
jgi:hypothetical protein